LTGILRTTCKVSLELKKFTETLKVKESMSLSNHNISMLKLKKEINWSTWKTLIWKQSDSSRKMTESKKKFSFSSFLEWKKKLTSNALLSIDFQKANLRKNREKMKVMAIITEVKMKKEFQYLKILIHAK